MRASWDSPWQRALLGSEGLLYASVALIPIRLFMWSAGLALFTATDRKSVVKKLLTHPCMVAVYIGLVPMISGPSFFPRFWMMPCATRQLHHSGVHDGHRCDPGGDGYP